jgi:tRNA-modifying protein YgfZ
LQIVAMTAFVSTEHRVVVFAGADAKAFLQSQLTNDVAALAVGEWQWQGYCSAKGRLHATFALARIAEDAFAAVLHASVLEFVVKRLTMFRLRSKLTIEISATLRPLLHLAAPDPNSAAKAVLDLGQGRWISIIENTDAATADEPSMQAWQTIGIEAMQPEITAATNEMFVPQMIAWDVITPRGGVSFSKGCYPGQEVVARAHYRGAVKRHLERATLADDAALSSGSCATLADGREAEVCNIAAAHGGSRTALVVVAAKE